jgi:ADP-ribose pyrophosphatase
MLQPSWKRGTQSSVNNRDDWQILDSVTLFKNPHIEIRQERVIPPGENRIRDWTISLRKKAVVIAPVTAEGKFVLVRQARIPVRKFLWEFPAGQVDNSSDPDLATLESTALRELEEETGYTLTSDGTLTFLGHYYTSQGFTDETPHLFLATPVKSTGRGAAPDDGESIVDCAEFSLDELRTMIDEYVIQDANTLAFFARLVCRFAIGGSELKLLPLQDRGR